MKLKYGILFAIVALVSYTSFAQVGIFDTSEDIGDADAVLGLAEFDNGVYSLDALTSEMNEIAPDNFHFAYSELSGSFSIQADPDVIGGRGGVMVRNGNGDSDAHASLLMTNDFNIWPHIRTIDGGGSTFDGDLEDDTTVTVRLLRAGDSVHFYRVNSDGSEELIQSEVIQFTKDSVLAGLAVSDNGALADFSNVSIDELPLDVHRTFPTSDYAPGMSMTGVSVKASVRAGSTADGTVQEIAPVGSIVSNVQASAGEVATEDNVMTWTLSGLSGDATLTYDIVFPNRSVVAFPGTFIGTGIPVDSFIGGVSVLPAGTPQFGGVTDPIDVNPFFTTVLQLEDGTPGTLSGGELGEADPGGFGLGVDPRTSGITVIDTDGTVNHVVSLPINIQQAGTYYLFGLVRGEDGNSDSWHFEMDALPSGADDSRWNITNSKTWGADWVEQEDPNNDPRPFELTAGMHTIYLANREDGASIDWLTVTTNPNIDIANFDAFTRISQISGRSIADGFLARGENETTVEISIIYRDFTSSVVITETPPTGFTASNINANGGAATLNADGSISWDISGVTSQELTLSYTLTAPSNEGNTFKTAIITGTLNIEGEEPIELSGNDSIVLEGNAVASSGKTVYHMINVEAEELADLIMDSHLRNQFGLEIIQIDDGDTPGFERPADLSGVDMAIVSGSVGSGNIGGMNYHVNAPEPLITYESFLYDDFSFSPVFDFTTSTDLEIIDNGHPITEGLDLGLLTVFREEGGIAWSNPPEGVRILATPPGEPNNAAVWVIEAGSTVDGNTIPGIRLGLWSGTFTNMSNQGIDLMNRIIAYSLGEDAPEPPTAINDYMLY
ncbi:MAG: hypothetical protein P9L94_03030 [Candidatus Hinthialibacter antarcticus]|nr:hypothetical protein [Candidatus Hinthialibacter antarcticus]